MAILKDKKKKEAIGSASIFWGTESNGLVNFT